MKAMYLLVPVVLVLLSGCGSASQGNFGEAISAESALTLENALAGFDTVAARPCKLEGEVTEVCQAEGCWFRLTDKAGRIVLVRTSDHSFAVPRDMKGRMAVAEGELKHDTTDVATLKQYAREDGKSEEEIAAIAEPQVTIVLEARGVIVR